MDYVRQQLARTAEFHPSIWWVPERPLHAVVLRILARRGECFITITDSGIIGGRLLSPRGGLAV